MTCEFTACERPAQSCGLCTGHLSQYYRDGKDKTNLTPLRQRLMNSDPSIPEGYKICRTCLIIKEVDEFHNRSLSTDGKDIHCRPCAADRKRRYTYGITPEEVLDKLNRQSGNCAICDVSIVDYWHVDHNHNTGQVRDLLCNRCNLMIGMADEDPEILNRASAYVWKWQNG